MSTLIANWLPTERAAWRPAERLSPSTWAEQHRVLSRTQSARPGRWSNAQSPYLTGLMDLCARRDIEEITIVKAAQIGVSEAIRNVIGYYAHQEPDPILVVLPDEQTGRKIVAQRIVPLLKNTPVLHELFTTARAEHAAPPHKLPSWTQALYATADTQKDHLYFVVRAWGAGYRSQRIDHGLVTSFDELRQRTLNARFPWDGPNRNPVAVQVLGIDSGGTGNRTHEVYRFALTDQGRIRAMKGQSHSGDVAVTTEPVTYRPPNYGAAPFPVYLTMMDTSHFKNRLAHAIMATVPEVDPKPAKTAARPRCGPSMPRTTRTTTGRWPPSTRC